MLAYAAQGLPNEQAATRAARSASFLHKCDAALTGCAAVTGTMSGSRHSADGAVRRVHRRHRTRRADAQAAVQLVLAQPSIGSQLVDNLNASIHLRAVLTDLFLIDEVFKTRKQNS